MKRLADQLFDPGHPREAFFDPALFDRPHDPCDLWPSVDPACDDLAALEREGWDGPTGERRSIRARQQQPVARAGEALAVGERARLGGVGCPCARRRRRGGARCCFESRNRTATASASARIAGTNAARRRSGSGWVPIASRSVFDQVALASASSRARALRAGPRRAPPLRPSGEPSVRDRAARAAPAIRRRCVRG